MRAQVLKEAGDVPAVSMMIVTRIRRIKGKGKNPESGLKASPTCCPTPSPQFSPKLFLQNLSVASARTLAWVTPKLPQGSWERFYRLP